MRAMQATFPDVRTRGWRAAVVAELPADEGEEEGFRTLVRNLNYIPDGYAIDPVERWLHFFEVEVYNPMTAAKLQAYGKFVTDMDSYEVEFAVLVINKYGHINQVDLLPYYLDWVRGASGAVL